MTTGREDAGGADALGKAVVRAELWLERNALHIDGMSHGYALSELSLVVPLLRTFVLAERRRDAATTTRPVQDECILAGAAGEAADADVLSELQAYIRHNSVLPSDHVGDGRVVPLSGLRGWIQREKQRLRASAARLEGAARVEHGVDPYGVCAVCGERMRGRLHWGCWSRAPAEGATPATGRCCGEPAPDRSGRQCDKPKGHTGEHWTYGGDTLRWSSAPATGSPASGGDDDGGL